MEKIVISILVSLILSLFSKYKNALTDGAIIVACLLSIIITYCLGIEGFVILLVTFLGTVLAGKILRKKRDAIVRDINQKPGKRDEIQVFANVGIGAFSAILFYITNDDMYFMIYACVMASSLADCMASEIGVLSKVQPVDICTFKRITKGISGGVSLLGLLSSLFGSFLIGLAFFLISDFDLFALMFITALGFVGALIDSILGSLIQVKYKCPVCGKNTEKIVHCNSDTVYSSGIKFVNNDMVNILNNFSVFVIAIVTLSII